MCVQERFVKLCLSVQHFICLIPKLNISPTCHPSTGELIPRFPVLFPTQGESQLCLCRIQHPRRPTGHQPPAPHRVSRLQPKGVTNQSQSRGQRWKLEFLPSVLSPALPSGTVLPCRDSTPPRSPRRGCGMGSPEPPPRALAEAIAPFSSPDSTTSLPLAAC